MEQFANAGNGLLGGNLESVISRVLFLFWLQAAAKKVMVIPLGALLPVRSSNLPESLDGPPLDALLFGFAPDGACLALDVTTETGELLPHRFTLTPPTARRSAFCCAFLLVTETGRYPASRPVEPGLSSRSQ